MQEIENVCEVGNMYNTNIPVHETHGKERHNDKLFSSVAGGTAAPTRILAGSPAPANFSGVTAPPAFLLRNANSGKPTSPAPQISAHSPRDGSFKGDHRSPPGQPPSTGNKMLDGDLAKVDLQASFAQSLQAWMSDELPPRRSEPPVAPDFLRKQFEIGTRSLNTAILSSASEQVEVRPKEPVVAACFRDPEAIVMGGAEAASPGDVDTSGVQKRRRRRDARKEGLAARERARVTEREDCLEAELTAESEAPAFVSAPQAAVEALADKLETTTTARGQPEALIFNRRPAGLRRRSEPERAGCFLHTQWRRLKRTVIKCLITITQTIKPASAFPQA